MASELEIFFKGVQRTESSKRASELKVVLEIGGLGSGRQGVKGGSCSWDHEGHTSPQSWFYDLTRLSSHGNAVELHCHLSLFVGQSRDYLHMTSIAKILKLLTNFIIKVLHKSLVHLMIGDLLTFGIKMSDFGAKTCLVCCIIGFPNLATSSLFTSNFLVINFIFGSKLVL